MSNAFSNPQVISTCADQRLLEDLKECNKLLEQVCTDKPGFYCFLYFFLNFNV